MVVDVRRGYENGVEPLAVEHRLERVVRAPMPIDRRTRACAQASCPPRRRPRRADDASARAGTSSPPTSSCRRPPAALPRPSRRLLVVGIRQPGKTVPPDVPSRQEPDGSFIGHRPGRGAPGSRRAAPAGQARSTTGRRGGRWWSGWWDSNPRPRAPKARALPLRYTPTNTCSRNACASGATPRRLAYSARGARCSCPGRVP